MPHSRTTSAVLVVLAAGIVGVGTMAALAASSAAGRFELMFQASHEAVPASPTYPFGLRHTGTFTSSAPFCPSGTLVDIQVLGGVSSPLRARRQYTCDDGSGSLVFFVDDPELEHGSTGTWSIEEGTGRYAGLRGRGQYRGEILSGSPSDFGSVVFRASWQGVADFDAVAPTISVTSARATKLRRPAGAYSIRVALVMRDDVDGNTVMYAVTAKSGGATLATKAGSTTGSAAVTFRVRPPNAKTRTIQLAIEASDPVGNKAALNRLLKLPR